ncbi:two-component regulator propeller domain-containing protein, partial [Aquiflexum sp.]|uniref:ligand-binding sensor domain-containing protein n=1 Tax=Aquiflexum sp. TaxID=1872584 RepID=UPI00359305BE
MKPLTSIVKVILVGACIILNTAEKNYAQQQPSYLFEHFQLPGGNQANYINGIAEDSHGFMWFSSWNGLYRYDGYSFTNYTHDIADPTSLSSNWVETVYIDGEGTLWAGTYGGGLNRFNPDKGTFTHFRNDPNNPASISQDSVTVIMEDHKGQLWVGTMGGLNRMDDKTGTFTRYMYDPDDPTSLGNDQVRVMFEDSQGTFWIGTNSPFGHERNNPGPGGLHRFNRETEIFTRYIHDPNDPNTLSSNHVMSIFEDSGGTFWIGTWNNGLHTMDRESEIFTRHVYNPEEPDKLSPPISDFQTKVEGGVCFIHEDDQGAIWIGSYGLGLNRYDPRTDKLIRFESNPDDPSSLSSTNVWKMYQSQDGTYWISMAPGGLDKVHSTRKLFEHYALIPMHSNNFMNVLDADDSGILRVNACCPENNIVSFQHLKNGNFSYRADSTFTTIGIFISAIEQTKDGTLWLGSHEGVESARRGGLYQMDKGTDEIIPVLVDATNTGIDVGPVVYIFEDSEGLLWFGTKWTGLFNINKETGQVGHYTNEPGNKGSLSHSNVTTIYEAPTQPGVIWIGTEGGGLNRFDKETKTFTRFQNVPGNPNSLYGEYITSIYEEAPGFLLIGTSNSGLNRFDVKNNTFTHFTAFNSGLSDNYVSCILGDKNGHIWIGTSKGLSRFDPESRSFYSFGPRHGVNAFPFVSSCDCDQFGNLIFGGINGITVFNPDKIELAGTPSPVVFTNFIVAGQSVRPEADGPLQAPIWKSREIRLPHNKSTFSFEFAALDYRDPQSNQYAYMLEGYDPDWRDAGTLHRANYTRVPHGEYVFRVRAANSEGVWNLEGASIRIMILPPWWQTWWAYVLYTLIVAAIILTFDRFQRRKLIEKEQERARKRELEQEKEHTKVLEKAYDELEDSLNKLTATQSQLIQQEKLASLGQLTAGIAHEIQNPLNFVNNFSEVSGEMIVEVKESRAKSQESREWTDEDKLEDEILEDIKQNLEKINHHGKRADAIVKGMLEHSRTSTGEKVLTDINALADEYLRLSYHGMRAKDNSFNAEYETHFDPDLPKVNVVPQDIGRVLLNVINNAFQAVGTGYAMSLQPMVTVSTKNLINKIQISIKDNGPGIPDTIKDKIFQPFFTTKP